MLPLQAAAGAFPLKLWFLLASDPEALPLLLGVAYRTISRFLSDQAGLSRCELRLPDVAIQAPANWLKVN